MSRPIVAVRRFLNRRRIRIPAAELAARLGADAPGVPVESLVIPAVGEDYADEGALAARFAGRFYPGLREIVIVSDLGPSAFPDLPSRARVATIDVNALMPREHAYSAIFKSRLVKVLAPLQASHERVVITDSDLVILKSFCVPFADGCLMGSFRQGRLISKVRDSGAGAPSELAGTYRPYLREHLNSAFLAATQRTWEKLIPSWLGAFIGIWAKLPDNQPPTDQLPLACVL
ncbi:MAG TPA: hypothetical protein VFX09_05975, partial [Burkholderiales bacterium]|nr:hypothetical protein [Burkholderiales bacterium]